LYRIRPARRAPISVRADWNKKPIRGNFDRLLGARQRPLLRARGKRPGGNRVAQSCNEVSPPQCTLPSPRGSIVAAQLGILEGGTAIKAGEYIEAPMAGLGQKRKNSR
jgi:hypothetical protein